jgi:hypothetical protein
MTGRPTKLSPERANKILESLRAGIGRNATIEAVGVGRTTFYRWLELGAKTRSGKYRDFRNRIRQAEACAQIRCIVAIQRVAMGGELVSKMTVYKPDGTVIERQRFMMPDFRAACWWLERRYPAQWGRRTGADLSERRDRSELIWIQDRGERGSYALPK